MTWMLKVKIRWDGFPGAPGYTNLFFRDFTDGTPPTQEQANAAASRVDTFVTAIKPVFPAVVKFTVQSDIEVIEDTTGEMSDVKSVAARTAVAGTSASTTFSGASGMVINWRTAGVRNGRRVRGRTFLVPIAGSQYDSDGTIAAGTVSTIQTAAAALADPAGTPDLGVYARPVKDVGGNVLSPGAWFAVTSASVPDLAAVLKSRR